MNLDSISRDDWILGGAALLLVIDLLFMPWFSILGFSLTATDAPDGALGILAVLAAIALIVDLAVERLSPRTTLPAIGGGRAQTRLVLAAVTTLLVALKFLFNIHFSLFGFGFWAAVVLTAALLYVAVQARNGAPLRRPVRSTGD